jgi:uncharacterized membrane protein
MKTIIHRPRGHHIRIKVLFLTGFLVSFLGWVWETLYAALILQSPNDRGFLILPICPIYGISVIAIYLLFRTPDKMSLFGKDIAKQNPLLRYLAYFLLSALSATMFELITGFFFDKVFHIHLWNYKDSFGSIGGYVAFFPSLLWGFIITAFMRLVFLPVYGFVQKHSHKTLTFFFWLCLFLLLADTSFNFSYLLLYGKWFNFNFLF